MRAFGAVVQHGCGPCQMPESKDSGGRRFVSAQDVAEHAGVSRSAVSRAFTPGASIAPATLARVQEAAFALGYQVNHLARGLHAHRSQLVGLVTSDPDTPVPGADDRRALARPDRARQRAGADQRRPDRRGGGERRPPASPLPGGGDRVPVRLARRPASSISPAATARRSSSSTGPKPGSTACAATTAAGRGWPSRRCARPARRGFAVVNMADPSPSLLAREQAFAACAAARGLALAVVRAGHSDYEGGQEAARRLLAEEPPPDAVFCVNDLMAFGALDHLRGAGLRVPDDVSVIGFDDVPMAGWGVLRPHHLAAGPWAHRQRSHRHPRPPRRRARPAAPVRLLPGRACRPWNRQGTTPDGKRIAARRRRAAATGPGGLTRDAH